MWLHIFRDIHGVPSCHLTEQALLMSPETFRRYAKYFELHCNIC